MARLWSSGFELNDVSGKEYTNGVTNAAAISTATKRIGTYALRINRSASTQMYCQYQVSTLDTTNFVYMRAYIFLVSSASTQMTIMGAEQFSGFQIAIRLNTDDTIALYNTEDAVQIGSNSSVLSKNTWYRVELKVDATTLATTACDARIDGVSFASGTANLATGYRYFSFGSQSASASVDMYFDDLAVNDSTGSFQTSFPGAGEVRHLNPSATGDAGAWTKGGSSTRATNWEGVNDLTTLTKTTPNDGTDFNSSNTLNQEDLLNLEDTPAGIGATDTINVVQVGVRFNGAGASANASFKLEIEASAAGTIEQGSALTPTNTTWVTNAASIPRPYSLTLYDLPGASTTAWTKTDLDAAQIGYKLTATSTNAAQVSTVWLLVDSTPAAAGATATYPPALALMGVGM